MKDSTEAARKYALKKLGEELVKANYDQSIAGLFESYHISEEHINTFKCLIQGIRENGEKEGRREVAEKVMAALSPYLPRS